MWVKLDKAVFGLQQHVYVACVYIAPEGSTANKEYDPFIIKDEIAYFSSLGEIVLLGDFNSRIANKQETLVHYDVFEGECNSSFNDEVADIIERKSQDAKKNSFGTKFLEMLEASHLTILNGRTTGDMDGKLTCHKYNGSSVVDYCVTSSEISKNTVQFRVLPPVWFSDHCPLQLILSINNQTSEQRNDGIIAETISKYIWDENGRSNFVKEMQSDEVTKRLKDFCSNSHTSSEKAALELENIIIAVADKTLKQVSVRRKKTSSKQSN